MGGPNATSAPQGPPVRPCSSQTPRPSTRDPLKAGQWRTPPQRARRPLLTLRARERIHPQRATATARRRRAPDHGSARLRPSPACPQPVGQAWLVLAPTRLLGPGLRLHGSKRRERAVACGKGSARARRSPALTTRPLSLQLEAPTPRGASCGQVTLRPIQAPSL